MALREATVALAHRHRRYGAGMIYLKLRQRGLAGNHKRVERLYGEAGLQVQRRRRNKVTVGERQPLVKPGQANEVWSMDFVFDRSALVSVEDLQCAITVHRLLDGIQAKLDIMALGQLSQRVLSLDRLQGRLGQEGRRVTPARSSARHRNST